MRTTVDLPPALHRRAVALARANHASLSSTIAELTARGLAQLDQPITIATDARSGLPVFSIGRRISSSDVADLLDDE